MSVLADSYYDQAVLTEDLGVLDRRGRLPVRAQRPVFPVCLTGGESRAARVRRYVPGVALNDYLLPSGREV